MRGNQRDVVVVNLSRDCQLENYPGSVAVRKVAAVNGLTEQLANAISNVAKRINGATGRKSKAQLLHNVPVARGGSGNGDLHQAFARNLANL